MADAAAPEKCRICRVNDADSFEHVPPRAALNDKPQTVYGIDDWLARAEDGTLPSGRIEQRGAGGQTLCQSCNNNTGSWYGTELARTVAAGVKILREAPLDEYDTLTDYRWASVGFKKSATGPHPLRFIKQVVAMLLAASPIELSANHPELSEFVLDKDKAGLPDRYKFYLSLFAGPYARTTGIVANIDIERGREDIFAEVAFPPYAYVMSIDSEPDLIETVDITLFVDIGYNQQGDIELDMLIGFGHTLYPADYRTSAMIERDRIRNEQAKGSP